jgi:hypothetical protein
MAQVEIGSPLRFQRIYEAARLERPFSQQIRFKIVVGVWMTIFILVPGRGQELLRGLVLV